MVDGEHHGVVCAAQQKLHIEVLDVAALEVVHDAGTGGKHRQDDVVLIGEQGPHLVQQRDAVLPGKAHLHRHVLGDALPGVEVLQQQQGNGGNTQTQHEDGIAVDILFQPHRQQHHVDDHADDHAGEQRPGHLPDKLHLGLLFRIPSGKRADVATEQVEKGRPHRVVADNQKEEVVPIGAAQVIPWEQENQAADGDGDKAKNQVPGTKAPLPGLGVLDEPPHKQAPRHRQNLGEGHHHLVLVAHHPHHLQVFHAVDGAGLLGEELFHQSCDGVHHKDESQRTHQVAQDFLLF